MANSDETVAEKLSNLRALAESLIMKCQKLSHLNGIGRLAKKCNAELKFLARLAAAPTDTTKESQLNSSNLSHLQSVVLLVENLPDIVEVLRVLRLSINSSRPILVDVASNGGYVWVKAIARNTKALEMDAEGQLASGEKSLVRQAEEFVELAKQHPHNYIIPRVLFVFFHTVPPELRASLIRTGVGVSEGKELFRSIRDSGTSCTEYLSAIDTRSEDETMLSDDNFAGVKTFLAEGSIDSTGAARLVNPCEKAKTISADPKRVDVSTEQLPSTSLGDLAVSLHSLTINSDCDVEAQGAECDTDAKAHTFLHNVSVDCDGTKYIDSNIHDVKLLCNISKVTECMTTVEASTVMVFPRDIGIVLKVNLDVTALIALVSNLCHGRNDFIFKDNVLTLQAAEERSQPALSGLHEFLRGKELIACETALADFAKILSTIGGAEEHRRAEALLKTIRRVVDNPSSRALALRSSARITKRAVVIFGTGDSERGVTVSANAGFVRAATKAGVEFCVFLHRARALTERKELTATPLAAAGNSANLLIT